MILNTREKLKIVDEESYDYIINAKRFYSQECHRRSCNPLSFYKDKDGNIKDLKGNLDKCEKDKKTCLINKKIMLKKGYITYQDATIIAIQLLTRYPRLSKVLAKKFTYLIIDEAQDTSKEQMEIFELLIKYGLKNILLIGDPDQAIYEWRDADPSIFLNKFNSEEWQGELLNENFRCSQKICNATRFFSTLEESAIAKGDTKDFSFKPLVILYDKNDKESLLNEYLKICTANNIEINNKNVAVLVRGRSGLTGKDYSRIEKLWSSSAINYFANASFEREYGSSHKAMMLIEKGLYRYFLEENDEIDIQELLFKRDISEVDWDYLKKEVYISLPGANLILKEWVQALCEKMNDISSKFKIIPLPNVKLSVKGSDKKYSDFLQQPLRYFFVNMFNEDFLSSTIHSVKGRTFDAVLLRIGTTGKLTSNILNNRDVKDEEIRTAYVAMTRARKVLVVGIPNTIKVKTLKRFPTTEWSIVDIEDLKNEVKK